MASHIFATSAQLKARICPTDELVRHSRGQASIASCKASPWARDPRRLSSTRTIPQTLHHPLRYISKRRRPTLLTINRRQNHPTTSQGNAKPLIIYSTVWLSHASLVGLGALKGLVISTCRPIVPLATKMHNGYNGEK